MNRDNCTNSGMGPEAEPPFNVDKNIEIGNPRLEVDGDIVDIVCDVSWADSWRTDDRVDGNWDAAWVFVKYRSSITVGKGTTGALSRGVAHHTRSASGGGMKADRMVAAALAKVQLGLTSTSVQTTRDGDTAAGPPPPVEIDLGQVCTSMTGGQAPGEAEMQTEKLTLGPTANWSDDNPEYEVRKFGSWRHAKLCITEDTPQPYETATVSPSPDGMGAFVHRAPHNFGKGPVHFKDVRLRWDMPKDTKFPVEIWIQGTEMVYVPAGKFWLGDPQGSPKGPDNAFHRAATSPNETNRCFQVVSEDTIPVQRNRRQVLGTTPHLVWDNSGQNGSRADIPAKYPKGVNAYYCMKRQITQGQYADLINGLRGNAVTARFPYGGQGQFRFTVYTTPHGLRAATRPDRACNWLAWGDAAAWAWWAGLRPMTEFEYEKACRGPATPVPHEYAWGTSAVEPASIILGSEPGSEAITGNCHIGNTWSPLRGGDGGAGPIREDAFLAQPTGRAKHIRPTGRRTFSDMNGTLMRDAVNERERGGVSYWGIIGLSGNLWEFVVSAGNKVGRRFTGVHGNGQLNHVGLPDFDRAKWPNLEAEGVGYRGGSWYTDRALGQIANRRFASGIAGYNYRSHDTGGRFVRTAPAEWEPGWSED